MSLIATRESDKDFELAPADTHIGTCYSVVDLGTQLTPFKDERTGAQKRQHQIRLSWELNCNMSDGRPFSIGRYYTLSLHEKSALCKDLEAWRGRAFTEEELKGFDIANIIGTSCLIGVAHKQNDTGKIRAQVSSILRLPKGMTAPPMVNKKTLLILKAGDFDQDVYNNLSDHTRDQIRLSPEYAECVKNVQSDPVHIDDAVPDYGVGIGMDEIPFSISGILALTGAASVLMMQLLDKIPMGIYG